MQDNCAIGPTKSRTHWLNSQGSGHVGEQIGGHMCPYQLQMRDSQALFGQDLLLIWTDWTKKHRVSIFDWLASNFAGLEFHLWSLKVASFITLTINSFHCYASSTVDPLLGGHLRTKLRRSRFDSSGYCTAQVPKCASRTTPRRKAEEVRPNN